MIVHALELQFTHPESGEPVTIFADLQHEFKRMIKLLGIDYPS